VRVAYCAELEGKFWQMDRWLFEHGAGKNEVDLADAAEDVGLDEAALTACMKRPDLQKRADTEARAATKLRIIETPTYRVGTKRLSPKEVDVLLRNPG
jgi:protein-disulfide isomerase